MLAEEALAGVRVGDADAAGRVALARFFAENIAVQAGGLETTVTEGADSFPPPHCRTRRPEEHLMTEQVIVTDDGAIRTIRMNRPEKKNALTSEMYDAMAEAIETASGASPIRCVLIAWRARRVLGRE